MFYTLAVLKFLSSFYLKYGVREIGKWLEITYVLGHFPNAFNSSTRISHAGSSTSITEAIVRCLPLCAFTGSCIEGRRAGSQTMHSPVQCECTKQHLKHDTKCLALSVFKSLYDII